MPCTFLKPSMVLHANSQCVVLKRERDDVEKANLSIGADCSPIGQYKRASHSLSSIIATATSTTTNHQM
jgi:hypothetical protein